MLIGIQICQFHLPGKLWPIYPSMGVPHRRREHAWEKALPLVMHDTTLAWNRL